MQTGQKNAMTPIKTYYITLLVRVCQTLSIKNPILTVPPFKCSLTQHDYEHIKKIEIHQTLIYIK